MFKHASLGPALLTFLLPCMALPAQEHKELGRMWTFENAPLDWFEEAYGFRPTQEWLDALRMASLRYGQGCSASFVSPRGLIITNNHCVQGNVGEVTPADQNWIVDGFFANGLEQEVRVPGLTVQQLIAQKNVTEQMGEGVTDDMPGAERVAQITANRRNVLKSARDSQAELSHEIKSLYQGGMYQLYSYKVYRDIRLVCAPQVAVAEFGGDSDNFTYPRFCLDFGLVRAWEDDKPADTAGHYLRWKTAGPQDGETVFVTGNPGSTGRLETIAQMEYRRDLQYPRVVRSLQAQVEQLREQMAGDTEVAKTEKPRLLQLENGLKAYSGFLAGLNNDVVMKVKAAAEKRIRDQIDADPQLKARFGDLWTRLEKIADDKRAAAEAGSQPSRDVLQEEQAIVQRIGEAHFAVYGTAIPPDATFSLRITDGVVKGFPCNGTLAPWFTSLYGLYARNIEFADEKPFHLPDNWKAAREQLDLTTPFNFVTTCDITGGNSGSPLVDTEGRFVGLAFDGNIESLANRFVFTDDIPRTVCVHPAIIIAALRHVYDRAALADELEGTGDGYK